MKKNVRRSEKFLPGNSEVNFAYATEDDLPARPKIAYHLVQGLDENNEVVYEKFTSARSQNGAGFVLSYSEKISDLIIQVSQPTVLRVFFFIAHNQHFDLGGFRISRKRICEILKVDAKSVYSALKWLEEHYIVLGSRIDGQSEFMVNPNYVTVGSNKKARLALWNRRWEEHWQQVYGNRAKRPLAVQIANPITDSISDVDSRQQVLNSSMSSSSVMSDVD